MISSRKDIFLQMPHLGSHGHAGGVPDASTVEIFGATQPWLVRQNATRETAKWLPKMLGFYSPSLPRLLSVRTTESIQTLCLGSAPGEPLAKYTARVGPLPVSLACALVWRLASELEILASWLPEALTAINPLHARVSLWAEDFLLLFVDRFEPLGKEVGNTPALLLRTCAALIGGNATGHLNDEIVATLPTSLLQHLRGIEHRSASTLDLGDIKRCMLTSIAAVTRGLQGSNLYSIQLALPRWAPVCGSHFEAGACAATLEDGSPAIRLSRILAHRRRLGSSEVEMLLEKLAIHAGQAHLSLDPRQILLPLRGQNLNDPRVLDARLDSRPDLRPVLAPMENSLAFLARSPVTFAEACQPEIEHRSLLGDFDAQAGRFIQVLQDGTYSLSGQSTDSSSDLAIPGLFSFYLGNIAPPAPKPPTPEKKLAPPSIEDVRRTLFPPQLPLHLEAPTAQASGPQTPMKMILITAGSGGTGKSTIARLIYELAGLEQRDDVSLFDCDALGNRDFQRIAPEKIQSMPIDNVDTMRVIVENAMAGNLVMADLPASCQDILARDLSPEIIESLRQDEGLHWVPIHPVTAKAATLPAIQQWRNSVFGDAPSILVVCLKDGPVSSEILDEIVRPQDIVLRMPVIDQSLAGALDASCATWSDILDGKVDGIHRMFANPLVRRQLKQKRKECEDALFPLLRRIIKTPVG